MILGLRNTRRTTMFHTLPLRKPTQRMLLKRTPIPNLLIKELINIQPHHLCLLRNPQMHTRDILQNHTKRITNHKTISRDGGYLSELFADLDAVAVNAARGLGYAVEGGNPGLGEDSCKDGAGHAAYGVEFEDVEAFVYAEPFVDVGAEGADDGGDEAD